MLPTVGSRVRAHPVSLPALRQGQRASPHQVQIGGLLGILREEGPIACVEADSLDLSKNNRNRRSEQPLRVAAPSVVDQVGSVAAHLIDRGVDPGTDPAYASENTRKMACRLPRCDEQVIDDIGTLGEQGSAHVDVGVGWQ